MDHNNQYTLMQKNVYNKGTTNHEEHNTNPDYWNILLGDLKDNDKWYNKNALDFACGKGRNVINIHSLGLWNTVDGVDISPSNIEYCQNNYKNYKSTWYCNNGVDISDIESNKYHFITSTIALQHIPVYDIRKNLLTEIFRILKKGGIFSFQMGYGNDLSDPYGRPRSAYYENSYDAIGTNSEHDIRITKENDIIEDLTNIGFNNVKTFIRDSYSDTGHPNWIYVKCYK